MDNIFDVFANFVFGLDYFKLVEQIPVKTALIIFIIFYATLIAGTVGLLIKFFDDKFSDNKNTFLLYIIIIIFYLALAIPIARFIALSMYKNYFFAVVFIILLIILDIALFRCWLSDYHKYKLILGLILILVVTFIAGNIFIPSINSAKENSYIDAEYNSDNEFNNIEGFQ